VVLIYWLVLFSTRGGGACWKYLEGKTIDFVEERLGGELTISCAYIFGGVCCFC